VPLFPFLFACAISAHAADAPLPDPQALRQRAIASARKLRQDRENYSCTVREESVELNGDGSVKKKKTVIKERFYVNGRPVDHVLARDGQTLSGGDARKEQDRTDKEVKKFSDVKTVEKSEERMERQLDAFLAALRFSNGHRETRDGRTLVVYDLAGDPNFHPRKLEETFAQSLTGTIWMDEESGVPRELKVETARDVKIAGGVAANLHKGFQLHLVQERQPGGVWLTKVAEGSGDMRAALFLRQRFRFREELQQCHLFSVNTQQKVQAPDRCNSCVALPLSLRQLAQ
jgi:hypothetical protein